MLLKQVQQFNIPCCLRATKTAKTMKIHEKQSQKCQKTIGAHQNGVPPAAQQRPQTSFLMNFDGFLTFFGSFFVIFDCFFRFSWPVWDDWVDCLLGVGAISGARPSTTAFQTNEKYFETTNL